MSALERNVMGWFEIYVEDIERAKAFYEGVLQVQLTKLDSPIEMWGFPMDEKLYGAGGALAKMEGMTPGANSVLIYFGCEDCAVEASRVVQHGGLVLREKMAIGKEGFIVMIQDTEGNMIGLHSYQ